MSFYITTAIAYPNAAPHLGHALEIVQADVIARFHRLLGEEVHFQTGTDEHGTKNWQTAKKQGKEIHDFLDGNVKSFKDMYRQLNISYDFFIRTSDKKVHYPGAIKLWEELVKSGDIYKKKYAGFYCTGCEAFKTEKELIDNKCPNHPTNKIEIVEEENYFFKLSRYAPEIIRIIEKDEYKVVPEIRKNEILQWLKLAKDISFSRPNLPWGIPVPGDEEQVMYVWCDALSNYITGVGYGTDQERFNNIWPCDVHVIGKDILRFHAAFWPAMLLSAKIPLPKQLFVHGFILSKGMKMSKSIGNVIEPFEQIEKYGADRFRYYIIGAMPMDSDGDYSEELVKERINTELVGNLANLCYRVLSFTNKNFDSTVEKIADDPVIGEINAKFELIKKHYDDFNLKAALEEIMAVSALGNKYFQEKEPWKNKDSAVIGLCANIVKNLAILTAPVMPEFSEKLQQQLNAKDLKWKDLGFSWKGKIKTANPLIQKVE